MKIAYIYVRTASSCLRASAWAYNHGTKHASLPADVAWFIQHYHTHALFSSVTVPQ